MLLGAYTKDTIIKPNETPEHVDGGRFNYGTNVVKRMGLKDCFRNQTGQRRFPFNGPTQELGVEFYAEATPHSTGMTLEYKTSNVDHRTLYVTTTAGSFTVDQVKGISAKLSSSALLSGRDAIGSYPRD